MAESYLSRSALPDMEDSETGTGCRFPLKKLIPLIHATDDYSVLDFIEQSLGRVAIRLPKISSDLSDLCRLTMQSVKEFGQLMSEIESGIADGKITNNERSRILKEGHEAIQAIMALIKSVESE